MYRKPKTRAQRDVVSEMLLCLTGYLPGAQDRCRSQSPLDDRTQLLETGGCAAMRRDVVSELHAYAYVDSDDEKPGAYPN